MELITKIIAETAEETVSELFIDGKPYGFILEDQFREVKVKHDTRIPKGTYELKLRKWGGHHQRYTDKFPDFHIGMIQVINVPNFQHILFHIGNTDRDTSGCLLNGTKWHEKNGRLMVTESTKAYIRFYKKVAPNIKNQDLTLLHHRLEGK
jgi:hypothetical protein